MLFLASIASIPVWTVLSSVLHAFVFAVAVSPTRLDVTTAARIPRIVTTTRSSTSVKPRSSRCARRSDPIIAVRLQMISSRKVTISSPDRCASDTGRWSRSAENFCAGPGALSGVRTGRAVEPLPEDHTGSCRRPDYFVVVQVARLGDPAPALGYVVVTVADPAVAVTVTVAGVAAAPAASSRLPVVTAYRSLSTPTASPERTAPNPRAEVQVVDAVAPPSAMRISVPASLPA